MTKTDLLDQSMGCFQNTCRLTKVRIIPILDYEIIGAGSVVLRWGGSPPIFSPNLMALADQTWAARRSDIFNGKLLVHSGLEIRSDHIELSGTFTEYRFYYTQQRTRTDFGLRPIAVSGVIACEDHLIFAQRSPHVTDYPNWFELVPSGGIDGNMLREDGTVDYLEQLRQEFAEETTLPAKTIAFIEPLGVVSDKLGSVYDIACKIHLKTDRATVLAALAQSGEYASPTAVPLAEVDAWIAAHPVIPTTRAVLALYRQAF